MKMSLVFVFCMLICSFSETAGMKATPVKATLSSEPENIPGSNKIVINYNEQVFLNEISEGKYVPFKVLMHPDRIPYSYRNKYDEWSGIFVDLLKLASETYGFTYEIIPVTTSKEYSQTFYTGEADIIFDCVVDYDYMEKVGYRVTENFLRAETVLLRRRGTEEIKSIAVKTGSYSAKIAQNEAVSNCEFIEFDTMNECIEAVKKGTADGCYVYSATASYYTSLTASGIMEYSPTSRPAVQFRIAVNENAEPELYSLMKKFVTCLDSRTIQEYVTANTTVQQKSFIYYAYRNHMGLFIAFICLIMAAAFTLLVIVFVKQKEHRRSELALAGLKSMMDQITESFPMGIFAYTRPDRKPILANKEAIRLFGVEVDNLEELTYQRVVLNVHLDDVYKITEAIESLKEEGDEVEFLYRSTLKNGRTAYIWCSARLLAFVEGTQYVLMCLRDITVENRLRQRLELERAEFREALLRNAQYSYTFDVTDGYVREEVETSSGALLLERIGLEPPVLYDDLISNYLNKMTLISSDEDSMKIFSRAGLLSLYEKGITEMTAEYYMGESDRYYQAQILLAIDTETNHILATVINRDMTVKRKEEIHQNQLLKEAIQASERAFNAKTQFFSSMSHDIRTPMNAISGMTLLAETYIDEKDKVLDFLGKIKTASGHLVGIVDDILEMSKIEAGKQELKNEELDLTNLVDTLLTMTSEQMKEKNHNLVINVEQITHEKVIGDAQKLQQVFVNIMSNAIKYTPAGGIIKLSVSEKDSGKNGLGLYEWVFEDNGIGMSEEFQKIIFEPFTREQDSRTSQIQGTGLGMSITKNYVSMMGGDIRVESKIGEGSKFTVTFFLPLRENEEEEERKYAILAGRRVLFVDDNVITCRTVRDGLARIGMEVDVCNSGKVAAALYSKKAKAGEDYFAIIIDYKMPEMDGIEFAKRLKRKYGDSLPHMVLSAYDWTEIELKARGAGIEFFVDKPLFKTRVRNLCLELAKGKERETESRNSFNPSEIDFGQKRVLLVEDNPINSEIACELFKVMNLQVESVVNGKEAVDRMMEVERGYYVAIFMDVQMPIMNGYEATRAIRELPGRYPKSVPIFAMTANAFADDVKMAKNAGMNEHIAKPIDIMKVVEVLNKWL